MTPFLQLVAEDLYSKYNSDLSNVCLVFPGKRAGLFFSRHLSKLVNKPVWLPPMKTISDLMAELSGLQIADPLILIFRLYEVYRKKRNTNETFDNFYSWGEILLNDFDDIDKYLVDTKQLFQNLSDLREIENRFTIPEEQLEIIRIFWKNINIHEPGPFKEEFLTIWEQLHAIYVLYKESLRAKGIAYEGMIYREICEKIQTGTDVDLPYDKFAIIGFNALNECEKLFFQYLSSNGRAQFYWDYDSYFIENTWHEAGFFIRDNIKRFPQSFGADIKFRNLQTPKSIKVIGIPSGIGQAKLIPTILNDFGTSQVNPNDTAVILADENLLIPVLSSLPDVINEVNVTLGYPFRLTPVHSFIELIIALQRSVRVQRNTLKYYHRDVVAILNHPYIQTICAEEAKAVQKLIIQYNLVYLSESDLYKHDYLKQLFQLSQTGNNFVEYLLQIGFTTVNRLKALGGGSRENDFHLEYWFTFLTALNKFKEILNSDKIELGSPVVFKLIRSIASRLSVPFKGEPLSGFQVMGVLETRNLDFKNIILLSANEGVLPKTDASVSYIPYNLRKGFGLPTIEHQDAIFAYYFYRFIQRAENIALVYNSQAINNTGEMSRFLYQLKYEPIFSIKEISLNYSIHIPDEKEIIIPKDKEILDTLLKYTDPNHNYYLTPTALSNYLECSLRFYFKYIVKIKEKEEVTEDVDGSMFGRLLHYAMQFIYNSYIGKPILAKDLEQKLNDDTIENAVKEAFRKEYFKSDKSIDELHGKNIIVYEVLKKYIKEILEKDSKYAPYEIIALENQYKSVVSIGSSGNLHTVNVGGVVDRIDKKDNLLRIIDYKTGVVETTCSSLEQIFDRSGNTKRVSAIFQSLLYANVLSKQIGMEYSDVIPAIYALRKIFMHDFDPYLYVSKQKINGFSQVEKEFTDSLKVLIEEIFNPAIPFTKVEDKTKCEYCAYRLICHR
jgi:hypothetical protein